MVKWDWVITLVVAAIVLGIVVYLLRGSLKA